MDSHLCAFAADYRGKMRMAAVSKLSKRHGATSFEDLMADGYLPEAVTNYIALLGWCPKDNQEMFTLEGLTESFSIDGISKSPAVFDYDKLTWFNGEYIRGKSPEEFLQLAKPYFRQAFPDTEAPLSQAGGNSSAPGYQADADS